MNYLQQGTFVRPQLDIAALPLHCSVHVTFSLILCLNIYDQVFVLRPSCVPKKGDVNQKGVNQKRYFNIKKGLNKPTTGR